MSTTQLFIDLDGVLADFDGHYERLFGARPDRELLDPPNFWKNICSVSTFYRDLPLTRDALDLWRGACALHASPVILTGLPRVATMPDAERHKREWVAEHIGNVDVICTQSQYKCLHGKPGDILVDDWDRYRGLWTDMGGIFVLHTSVADSLAQLERLLR